MHNREMISELSDILGSGVDALKINLTQTNEWKMRDREFPFLISIP